MNKREWLSRYLTATLLPRPQNIHGASGSVRPVNRSDVEAQLSDELEMARHVQEGLLPKHFPTISNMELSAAYLPNGKVGGDLYDVVLTPQQKVALLIFDVSGHGVPAALIGTMAKMLFSQFIERLDSPAEIFRNVNTQLCHLITTNHYLTAFLGFFDPWSWTLTFAHAAHVPPIIFRSEHKTVSVIGGDHGNFIGHASLADIAKYHDSSIQLNWGDKILLYTDGLTDASNQDEEMYGSERLLESIRRNGSLPVNAFLSNVLGDMQAHSCGYALRDDVTMLAVQIGCENEILLESGLTLEQKPFSLVIHIFAEIEKACAVIMAEVDSFGYSEKLKWRAKFCICEVLSNAIVHGNCNNPDKKVIILYTVTADRMAVSVTDQGNGFDYRALPFHQQQNELNKERGRGLFLVHQYMDNVNFNKRGNRIKIEKFRKGVQI
jgi:anti-sigma regulatory factor (Ser/Thr protein kinase)